MNTLHHKFPIHVRAMIVWATLFFFVVSLVSYIFFIQKAVVRTVERSHIEKALSVLSSEVGGLESRYISLATKVGIEGAVRLGLKEVSNPEFISRQELGKTLSFNNEK